jgi:hypothetical protein
MKWSYQLSSKNQYIQKFEALGLPQWRIRCVDQTWYKQKFEWKFEFNFNPEPDRRRYGVDHRWVQILRDCEMNNIGFRRRREVWCNIYSSDTAFVDLVLYKEEYSSAIVMLEYTNDKYIAEKQNQTSLESITDIKFVKQLPEYCYQVFLGNFDWNDPIKEDLTRYLAVNKDDFQFRNWYKEVVGRFNTKDPARDNYGRVVGVYDGFNFFAKSTDDILLLHMIAPGKIKKIVKLMEKQK